MNGSSRDSKGQGKPLLCLLPIFLYVAGDNGDKCRISNPSFSTEVPLFKYLFPLLYFLKNIEDWCLLQALVAFFFFSDFLIELKIFTALACVAMK